MFFEGTPWGWNETEKNVRQYLSQKYTQTMVIDKETSLYDYHAGYYAFFAYPEGNETLKFRIITKNYPNYTDTYFFIAWRQEIADEISAILKERYNDSEIALGIDYDRDKVDNEWHISGVPSYLEAKNQYNLNITGITIDINSIFDIEKAEAEYTNIFDIIQFIKEKKINPDTIIVEFCPIEKNTNEWREFYFDGQNLDSIQGKDDIQKFESKR